MANDNNRKFQVALTSDTSRGATLLHIEGNAVADAQYYAATDDKKARSVFRIGLNSDAWRILGRAEGNPDAYKDKTETNFMSVVAFDRMAELAKNVCKGEKLVLAGKVQRSTYKKDDKEYENVQLIADMIVRMKDYTGAEKTMIGYPTVGKNGDSVIYLCCMAGEITKVEELATSTSGKPYLRFRMKAKGLVDKAYDFAAQTYDKDKDYKGHLVSVTVWEKRAETLAKILKEGMPIVVTGRATTALGTDGKTTFYRVNAQAITLYPKDQTAAAPAAGDSTPAVDEAEEPALPDNFAELPDDIIGEDGELPF